MFFILTQIYKATELWLSIQTQPLKHAWTPREFNLYNKQHEIILTFFPSISVSIGRILENFEMYYYISLVVSFTDE